jgi:hypothetical protein
MAFGNTVDNVANGTVINFATVNTAKQKSEVKF